MKIEVNDIVRFTYTDPIHDYIGCFGKVINIVEDELLIRPNAKTTLYVKIHDVELECKSSISHTKETNETNETSI